MKRILILLMITLIGLQAHAFMSYEDAYVQNDVKPMAVLVYADWVDNSDKAVSIFNSAQQELGNYYNFVALNISSNDAKSYNEIFSFLPKLPYIMLYRGKGKFSRQLDRNCVYDYSCIVPKMKSFLR